MEIKFKRKISDYKYLVMFDLASKITGVCVFDLKEQKPLFTDVIKVTGDIELPAAELKNKIDVFFLNLNKRGISLQDVIVSKERLPSQIRGCGSTIQTFMALARSHAILDTYLYENNIATYDYIGIAPVTTHAYYKRLVKGDKELKVTKELIRSYLYTIYENLNNISLDESDAVFLAKTLYDVKWNDDISEHIREIKRHRKTLKAEHAINSLDKEIERLESLKNKVTED